MSLLKWKELAKRKTELGNKINYAHNAITQHKIGQETSQESFKNIFKPITSKLDDVVVSNLIQGMPPQRRKQPPKKKVKVLIMPDVDPYEEMDVEGLINLGDYVPPQQEKQLVPKPPTYEQSLKDLMEKEIRRYMSIPNISPKILKSYHLTIMKMKYLIMKLMMRIKDEINYILNDIGIPDYDNVEKRLNQPEMTNKTIKILSK